MPPERKKVPDLVEDDQMQVSETTRLLARMRNKESEPLGAQELQQLAEKMADGQAKVALGSIIRTQNAQYKVKSLRTQHTFGFTYNVEVLKGLTLEKPPLIRTEPITRNQMLMRYKMIRYMVTILQTAERGEAQFREHFPKLLDAGNTTSMTFAVVEGTGDTLDEIMRYRLRSSFTRLTAYRVAIQTLIAIRDLHTHDWLHRFIRPHAFAVGRGARRDNIYMVDLGCPFMYRDPDTKKVRRPRLNFRSIGDYRYMSRHSHEAKDLARRDDLESWCYMCIEFFGLQLLPWHKTVNATLVHKMKESLVDGEYPEVFGRSSPALRKILKYAASMRFLERPDYKFAVQELQECQSMLEIRDGRNDWELYNENEPLDRKGGGAEDWPSAPRAPPIPGRDHGYDNKDNRPKRGISIEDDKRDEDRKEPRRHSRERSYEPKRRADRGEDRRREDDDERRPTKPPPRRQTTEEHSEKEDKPKKKPTKTVIDERKHSKHQKTAEESEQSEKEEKPKKKTAKNAEEESMGEKKAVRSQYLMAKNQQPEATEANSASEKSEATEPVRKAKHIVHLFTDANMKDECVNDCAQSFGEKKLTISLTTDGDTTTQPSSQDEAVSSTAPTPKKATTPKKAKENKKKKTLYQTAEEEEQPEHRQPKHKTVQKESQKPKKKTKTVQEGEEEEPEGRKKKTTPNASTPKAKSTPRKSTTPRQSTKSQQNKPKTQKSAKKKPAMQTTQDDE